MLSFVLIIAASLFFTGIVVRTKSICSGRKGPGILQPLRDVVRLFGKGAVYSPTTGWVFKAAPIVYFASVLAAVSVVPFGKSGGILSFEGDFVFFAYVLALGKFFSIIGALDTGSSFEGMGASREALYSMLAEPAFFMIIGSLALVTGYTSFEEMFAALHLGNPMSYALAGLASIVLLILAMIENSRMPVDDPKTHLELTMVHEVMILDNSGFDLGLILSAGYVKFAIYTALIVNLFIGTIPYGYSIPSFFAIQFLAAVIIGITESFMARFRMSHNPQFIFSLTSVSLLVLFGVLLLSGNFR
ncbi:MAG: NADH-quinone oxidoreductase subunit H [Bacteroidales bacterium]|nr:NADH-quinone oxidoreductase subunit H [Bacteroidales bacterium]MDD4670795.1 NADH-quinone oxidoreductase subunit H [Bacteroidales bacterium]